MLEKDVNNVQPDTLEEWNTQILTDDLQKTPNKNQNAKLLEKTLSLQSVTFQAQFLKIRGFHKRYYRFGLHWVCLQNCMF